MNKEMIYKANRKEGTKDDFSLRLLFWALDDHPQTRLHPATMMVLLSSVRLSKSICYKVVRILIHIMWLFKTFGRFLSKRPKSHDNVRSNCGTRGES